MGARLVLFAILLVGGLLLLPPVGGSVHLAYAAPPASLPPSSTAEAGKSPNAHNLDLRQVQLDISRNLHNLLTPAPDWEWHEAGVVTTPILLYHHVSDDYNGSRYYVSLQQFAEEMNALEAWGYTTITMSQFLDVFLNGGELPPRPIVITFDDGHASVYAYAFPIMEEFGLGGAWKPRISCT